MEARSNQAVFNCNVSFCTELSEGVTVSGHARFKLTSPLDRERLVSLLQKPESTVDAVLATLATSNGHSKVPA